MLFSAFFLYSTATAWAAAFKVISKKIAKLTIEVSPQKPFNLLLLGSDSRSESFTGRSDSIMLVHVDPLKRNASLISFPRDSRVPIPGRGNNKINAAMFFGGPQLTVKTVEKFSGLKIDYYVVTTFQSFIRLINYFKGVQVFVDKPINDHFAGPPVPGGNQRLDGPTALAFARSRKKVKGGDFGRAAHQQQIMVGLFKQERSIGAAGFLKIVPTLTTETMTNIGFNGLFKLGLLMPVIDPKNVTAVVLPGRTGMVGGASSVILDTKKTNEIFSKLR